MSYLWDERYSGEEYLFGTDPNDWLKTCERKIPRKARILCLGEGEGRNAVFLACKGHSVTAVDLSDVGLQKAIALADSHNVAIQTKVADLMDFDMGVDCWDAIVSIFCHLPPGLRYPVHQRASAALARGGSVILEAYTPRQLEYRTGGPSDATMLYTPETLQTDFSGLHALECRESVRDISEGSAHQGISAVVQLLAIRK